MDVDKVSFYPLLLDILKDISEAHFVAIDLELSGVPSKQQRSDPGKPTLQERYLETKEAAERYQILQIGITCAQQDTDHGQYILKPYNINLNPIIEERGLDIERIFSFQSGAVEFLLKVGFDLGKPFTHGVPYLSRSECREARDKHTKRQDKSALADIQLKPTEIESLAFLERVRGQIRAWVASRNIDALEYINIGPTDTLGETRDDQAPDELSRFEKRLVHQLVRAEFPELVSISKRGFVQIVRFNQDREDRIAAGRKRESSERINRQKGFRWVIEALLGSDLSNLDLRECARDPVTGEHVFADLDDLKAHFHRAHTLLKGNPRMLVGHNCFLDLIYIYNTFIGELPDTVTEFQRKLHSLWPVIVDTKYMSTHNCGDINPVSSLEQIAAQLSAQREPTVKVAEEHNKYEDVEAFHEAGYDSFLTAQIAVRLSSKLEREGAYVEPPPPTTARGKGVNGVANGLHGMNLLTSSNGTPNGTTATSEPGSDGFTPSQIGFRWKRHGDPTVPSQSGVDDPFVFEPKNLKHRYEDPKLSQHMEGGMPRLGSDFWRVYGNRLRVFGTEEGVCVLEREDVEGVEAGSDQEAEGQGGVGV